MTAILATVFLNNEEMKNTLAPHLRIYGPLGANGKTTFEELLRKGFGSFNVSATQIGDFDNYHFVETTVQSLIAIDGDSSSKPYLAMQLLHSNESSQVTQFDLVKSMEK